MPSEARDKKPGNRDKRDSQLILMNFFSRVTYNDRMSPLDFDIFRKVHVLMGVTPDFFEVVLMVCPPFARLRNLLDLQVMCGRQSGGRVQAVYARARAAAPL